MRRTGTERVDTISTRSQHTSPADVCHARSIVPDWQERIARDTPPQIRLEHVVRYAAAAPIVARSYWCDLGCGTGLAAAEAFRSAPPARALLVDIDGAAAEEAAARFPQTQTTRVALDLSRDDGVDALRQAFAESEEACITCFEVIEHLESFVPLVRFLVERAEADATVLLSVPNDALTGVRNPFHVTTWGEGSLAELQTALPEDHRILEQVVLAGSALRQRDEPPRDERVDVPVKEVAGPSHFVLAFGPRAGDAALPCVVEPLDVDEHRTWERQREADLAFGTARVEALEARLHVAASAPAEAQ
jgi:2-polyprenyl-3-methyl-5-hydroxy-6-metoxy-1,4-benzoquinol methylase